MARYCKTSASLLPALHAYQFLGFLLASLTVPVASVRTVEGDREHRRLASSEQAVDLKEALSCNLPVNTSCTSALSRQSGTVLAFSWVWDTPEEAPLSSYIAVGGHYVLVDDKGALWTWGRNDSNGGGSYGSKSIQDSGQMGWPRSTAGRGPGLIDSTSWFIAAAAGRYHSAALDEDGQLYTWGLNDFGQLGRDAWAAPDPEDTAAGETRTSCTNGWSCHDARVVAVPDAPEKFTAVAAGRYHTTVVSESGKVYTAGLNFCGNSHRLTEALTEDVEPNSKYLSRLTKVVGFDESDPVVAISAGYMLWTALTQSGKVYVCGTGFDGYAGSLPETVRNGGWASAGQGRFLGRDDIEHTPASFQPTLIDGPPFRAVAAGRNAAAAVAVDGSLYTWGSSALGRAPSGTAVGLVQGLEGHKMVKACMGEYHGVAIDDAGKAFVWGSMMSMHGLQDDLDGSPDNTAAPLKGMPNCTVITALACGHEHTVLITQPDPSCGKNTDAQSPVKEPAQAHAVSPTTLALQEPSDIVDTAQPTTKQPATVVKPVIRQQGSPQAAQVSGITPDSTDSTSDSVATVAQAAAVLLRGKNRLHNPDDQHDEADYYGDDDAEVQLASGFEKVANAEHEAELESKEEIGMAGLGAFTAQVCQNGAPRPAWIDTCDEIPSEVPTLDRAWYGRYRAPTLDKVCSLISRATCKRCSVPYVNQGDGIQVMRSSQDVFEDVLYPFLPSARSPCYLSLHRECSPFKASKNKGPHFWDEGGHNWDQYTDLFSVVSEQVEAGEDPVETLTVDASSNTFTVSGVTIRGQGYGPSGKVSEEVLLPDVVKATQPDSKLVVMLRNPVTRLWSSYWYYGCRYGLYGKTMSADEFHTYAEARTGIISKCIESGKSMRECARVNFGPAQQVVKGMYAAFAPDWFSVYPEHQIRWIQMEEYMTDPATEIQSLLEWLEVEVPDKATMEGLNNRATGNSGHDANPSIPGCEANSKHQMRDDTKSMLEAFYRPWNQMLAKQLGRDMWNYT